MRAVFTFGVGGDWVDPKDSLACMHTMHLLVDDVLNQMIDESGIVLQSVSSSAYESKENEHIVILLVTVVYEGRIDPDALRMKADALIARKEKQKDLMENWLRDAR